MPFLRRTWILLLAIVFAQIPGQAGNPTLPVWREGAYGYRLCGITELGEYEQIGTFVDRGYPSYDFPSAAHVERQCGMVPEVIVVPAFELKHPSVDAVRRATDKLMPGRHDIYATSEVAREKLGEEWSKIKGGGSWQVFVLDACSAEYPILQQSELYPTRSR